MERWARSAGTAFCQTSPFAAVTLSARGIISERGCCQLIESKTNIQAVQNLDTVNSEQTTELARFRGENRELRLQVAIFNEQNKALQSNVTELTKKMEETLKQVQNMQSSKDTVEGAGMQGETIAAPAATPAPNANVAETTFSADQPNSTQTDSSVQPKEPNTLLEDQQPAISKLICADLVKNGLKALPSHCKAP